VKKIRFNIGNTIIFLLILLLPEVALAGSEDTKLPDYKVTGRVKNVFSITVPSATSDRKIEALIFRFREMKKKQLLSHMIPGANAPSVWIFLFREEQWATSHNLDKYINMSMKNPSDKAFNIEFAQHVAGEYYGFPAQEYGTVGIKDEYVKSANYKKLF
jgi:hypothetical protein